MMTQIVSQTMGQPVSIEEKQAQLPAEAPVVAPILTPTMMQSVSPTLATTMMTQIVSQTMTQTMTQPVPLNETYPLTRFDEPCVSQTMSLSESTNYNFYEPIVTPATFEEIENMVQNYSSVSQTMRLSASTTKDTLEELETKKDGFSSVQNDSDVEQLCLEDLLDVFMDEVQDMGPNLENEKIENSPERIEFDAGVGFEIPKIPMEIED